MWKRWPGQSPPPARNAAVTRLSYAVTVTDPIAHLTLTSPTEPGRYHRVLLILRAAWLLLAVGLTYFYARGLGQALGEPVNLCLDLANCTPAQAEAFIQQLGLNPGLVYGLELVALLILVPLTCVGVAAFIIWRGGHSALVLATATCLTVYALFIGNDLAVRGIGPTPYQATIDNLALMLFVGTLFFALHTFPNGRFAPRWAAWVLAAEWLVVLGLGLTTGLESDWAALTLLVVTGLGLGFQVYRYRQAATRVEQQQVKWGLIGLVGFILNGVLWITWVMPATALGAPGLRTYLQFLPISLVLVLSLPVTLAIAVLRYRLWDIDVLIRRTLIYSVLTAVLSVTYFGLVVVLQAAAGQVTGQANSALATVLSTLAIAALFAPLRTRVQNFVDRRFYRRKYDTARTLAAFAVRARDEVNLDQLSGDLRGAVEAAMQPAHMTLWLRPGPNAKLPD